MLRLRLKIGSHPQICWKRRTSTSPQLSLRVSAPDNNNAFTQFWSSALGTRPGASHNGRSRSLGVNATRRADAARNARRQSLPRNRGRQFEHPIHMFGLHFRCPSEAPNTLFQWQGILNNCHSLEEPVGPSPASLSGGCEEAQRR